VVVLEDRTKVYGHKAGHAGKRFSHHSGRRDRGKGAGEQGGLNPTRAQGDQTRKRRKGNQRGSLSLRWTGDLTSRASQGGFGPRHRRWGTVGNGKGALGTLQSFRRNGSTQGRRRCAGPPRRPQGHFWAAGRALQVCLFLALEVPPPGPGGANHSGLETWGADGSMRSKRLRRGATPFGRLSKTDLPGGGTVMLYSQPQGGGDAGPLVGRGLALFLAKTVLSPRGGFFRPQNRGGAGFFLSFGGPTRPLPVLNGVGPLRKTGIFQGCGTTAKRNGGKVFAAVSNWMWEQ